MNSPVVQNLLQQFDGSTVDDNGERQNSEGFARPLEAQRGGVVSPVRAAKLAFEFWLKSVGPPRAVPRPESFYKGVVDFLWQADVFTKEDLALCTDPSQLGGSTTAAGTLLLLLGRRLEACL